MNLGGRESVLHLLLCGHLQRLRGSENSGGPTRETLGLRAERHTEFWQGSCLGPMQSSNIYLEFALC